MRNRCMFLVAVLLSAVLLWACSRDRSPFTLDTAPRHFNELRALESLLETDPAQAAFSVEGLLEAALEAPFTTLDSIELDLRVVQMQYKNRWLDENSPELAPVVAFYDSLAVLYPTDEDLCYLRANAHYYKGVEYTFANDDVEAFRHYLGALGVMRQFQAWDEHPYAKRFIALTYTRLSEILYSFGLYDNAMEACQQATTYFEKDADLAAMMRYEANIYQAEKEYDKALACFGQAKDLAPLGVDDGELALGAKLFEMQQYDSAYPHLKRAFASGDPIARVDAAAKLSEICRVNGKADEELRYTRFYVESSMRETRRAAKKMEIEYLFDEFNRPTDETPSTNGSGNVALFVIVALLVTLAVFMAFIIIRNRSRISHIESKITTIEQKHEQENADKNNELEQMAQQLNDTREQLLANRPDFDEAWKAFSDSDIVMKIRHSVEGKDIMIKNVGVYPKLKLKEMDYIGLVQEANRCFPGFSSRFLKDYPDLNTADLRHGCLGILGMNDAEIAVLEGISYSGANRRTNKILSVVGLGDNLEQALIDYLKRIM